MTEYLPLDRFEQELCRRKLVKVIILTNLVGRDILLSMEKRRRHYNLEEVKAVVADPKSEPFTLTAILNGAKLHLTPEQMREVILALSPSNFYKSMTTHVNHRQWQDVYHTKTQNGDPVYIKITQYPDERPPVIRFKAK